MMRDEILELEASRELDALIAEKVMGWTRKYMGEYGNQVWDSPNQSVYLENAIPHYSTDIAAAWEVVEHIEGMPDYWHSQINHRPASSKFSKYHKDEEAFEFSLVNFVFVETDGGKIRFRGGEYHGNCPIPLAICRAALLALVA